MTSKARPILFSGEMVRALLEGRKTQTRRIVKFPIKDRHIGCELAGNEIGQQEANELCPYGQPGDLLWVRESITYNPEHDNFYYAADKKGLGDGLFLILSSKRKSRPAIYMEKWASRLTLRITSVRVERLQDISQKDAIAEGITMTAFGCHKHLYPGKCLTATEGYRLLWADINSAGAWDKNPWVWVVEFEVIRKNIQEVIVHG